MNLTVFFVERISKISLQFKGGGVEPATPNEYQKLAGMAQTMKTFPNSSVMLTGNAGVPAGTITPLGNTPEALNSPNTDPAYPTTGSLMIGRADAAKKILTDNYKIGSTRIKTQSGSLSGTPAGRNVQAELKGVKL